MSYKIRINLFALVVAALVFQPIFNVNSAYAQNPVQFSDQSFENHFPDELVFRVDVSSSVGEIVSAKFVYTFESYYSSASYSKEVVEMEPNTELSLEHMLDTRNRTTPPMMEITYYWDVVDEEGNHYESEPITIRYEDTRYDWSVLSNEDVSVLWHDRPASFGKAVFEIAKKSILHQRKLFKTDLDYPIYIVIQNDFDEFAAWHSVAYDWVGGESFGNYGITAQIVRDTSYQESWLNDVVPHEISHLYFAQLTHNPTVVVPTWVNEGVAQYNEFSSSPWVFNNVRKAAKEGKIIPLSDLERGFGAHNEERVYLAYDEALMASTYFVENYGNESLRILLALYKDGQNTADAFQSSIGISFADFEQEWFTSIGVPDDYATNTPWPLPTFMPSPTMRVMGASDSTSATKTPVPASEILPTITKAVEPTSPPTAPLPCMSVGLVLSVGVGSVLIFRRRKKDIG